MKNTLILLVLLYVNTATVYSQQKNNIDEVKYVVFTSDKKADVAGEGIYKYTSKVKSDTHKSLPIVFTFVSKARGIDCSADYYEYDYEKLAKYRKVTEKDKRDIKEEPSEFLDSVNFIDMDILFPKMTKDEFIKTWNSLWDKTVYFIDRSEIKNNKVKLYPVKIIGINLY